MRDDVDKRRYLGRWNPKEGHFNGPRYAIGNVLGRTRVINTLTEDLLSDHGRERAQKQFIAATEWARKNGAKVILLAAATKRLFCNGQKLRELFPELIFTIGDNGTVLILLNEIDRAFREAGLKPENSRIAVLGPYGFLGKLVTKDLREKGYGIIGVGPNHSALKRIVNAYRISVCRNFEEVGKIDAVVACTHSKKIRLNDVAIELIRRKDKKLLIIDVAEPSNLSPEEYEKSKKVVIRQDAGNGYSPKLKYVLGAVSYKMFRLSRGVTFGCFAETLSIAAAIKRGEHVKNTDWFSVDKENIKSVSLLFDKVGFTLPSPRCFGEPIKGFELSINQSRANEIPIYEMPLSDEDK
ncbi:MAG: hypothetical protein K8I01_12185 [Candidatus Methylomirabilis sp.]|nr:hypothetical protein [Deltaproteobacteria bacterium]